MAEQKVKLTQLPEATDTIDTAVLLVNQNETDQQLPVTHFLRSKNNLSELENTAQARANLGVPSVEDVNDKIEYLIDGKSTFLNGATLESERDFIWDDNSKSWYYWTGAFSKEVPAASTPESTGGIGAGKWLSVGDAALRPVTQYRTNTIATLQSSNFNVGDFISVGGYYSVGDGANHFRVIASEDDGSGVQIANGLWANIVHSGEVHVSWFGAVSGPEEGAENLPDASPAITKAFNYYRYNLKFDPAWYRLSSSIPIGSHASFSTSSGNGQQWPAGNVYRFIVDPNVTRIYDLTLTNDTELRDFKISNFRYSPNNKVDITVIYSDMPLGPFEISHVHIDNATYFLKNTISDRAPANVGQFLSMGSRINIIDSFIRSDYTMYCDKGVAGSLWSNHNNITRTTISSFYIEASCQNWQLDSCLYEAWDKPIFDIPIRMENLNFINLYAEGIYKNVNSNVTTSEWNTAKSSGTLVRTVNDYYTSTTESYSVYLYNGKYYCGNASGTNISSVSSTDYTSIVKTSGPANITFTGCLFANFQSLVENSSTAFPADIYIENCSFFDNTVKANTHSLPLLKTAGDGLLNASFKSGLSTQKQLSNYPVRLVSQNNIKLPSSYNETRASGNFTLRNRININKAILYCTTDSTKGGRGYEADDPLYVTRELSSLIPNLTEFSRIVFIGSALSLKSNVTLPFKTHIVMTGCTLDITGGDSGIPSISASEGITIEGGTVRFIGTATSSNNNLISDCNGTVVFKTVAFSNQTSSEVNLINNAIFAPVAVRLYTTSVQGGDVYASKQAFSTATSVHSASNNVIIR